MPPIRWAGCASSSRLGPARRAGSHLPRRQLAWRPAQGGGRARAAGHRGRVGHGPDSQLEHRRLDRPVAAHRRQDRAPRRRRAGRADRRRLDLDQSLQGPQRRDGDGQGRRARAATDRLGAAQLSLRSLHRRHARARARLRARPRRRARDRGASRRTARDPAVDARQLPHRPHASDGRGHARRASRPARSVVWDLAHSAGVVPIRLDGDGATRRRPRTSPWGAATSTSMADPARLPSRGRIRGTPRGWIAKDGGSPSSGWMGHAAPFAFTPDYAPAAGIARFLCGTPPILSLAALECGVDTVLAAETAGGLAAIRRKSIALTDLFIELVESRCEGHGLSLVTPRNADGARQPGVVRARRRRLRHRPGAHRARRHRRLPRAGHPALRLRAALHPFRRRRGTPSIA